jgi:hypothetical protein
VLAHLKQVAQEHFEAGQPVQQAVIAVPASFHAFQRQALRNAARIAGLEVLRLVNETSAAAMAYLYKLTLSGEVPEGESHVLVFSLGAEHLEVSLATFDDGILEVKAVAFDDYLGGRHFDDRLLAHLEAVGSRLPCIGRLPAALPSAGTLVEADSCHAQLPLQLLRCIGSAGGMHRSCKTVDPTHNRSSALAPRCQPACCRWQPLPAWPA